MRKIWNALLAKMKRQFLAFFLLLMVLVSCEQPLLPDENSTGGDADGNLIVSVFQIEQQSFAVPLTRAMLTDYCSRLSMAVYDAKGSLVKQVHQSVGDASFGSAAFSLDPGTYRIVVVGHSSGKPTMTDPAKIKFDNSDGFTDTFLHSATVQISAEEEENVVQAHLKRITSLCRVVFTDAIPAGVTQMYFEYKGGSGAFDATTGLGSVNSTQKMTFAVEPGQQDCTFDLYTFLRDTEGTLQLQASAQDENGNEVCGRTFQVPMKQRMITRLSGPYFSGTSSVNIVIGIDAEWEGEQIVNF